MEKRDILEEKETEQRQRMKKLKVVSIISVLTMILKKAWDDEHQKKTDVSHDRKRSKD